MGNESLWVYFSDAGLVVKSVMLLLLSISVLSWVFIFQRGFFLKFTKQRLKSFEETFWKTDDLTKLYSQLSKTPTNKISGLEKIFDAGFKEYLTLCNKGEMNVQTRINGVQRAMRVACSREVDKLERHLPFLASVGSTTPYIGLFGTVWGIMTAFHALSNVQQASIAMVAPGISEALIATAMGLFAAIPAVLAYNRYANQVERIINHFDNFQDEFSSLLLRQSKTV
jgi:biopolymer transport protein TolQ